MKRGWRNAGAWALGAASLALAGWLLWYGFGARLRQEPLSTPALPAASAIPAAAPGSINVRVQVRVLNDVGGDEPVGMALPRRVALRLEGKGGQGYEAQFDRVGLWVMETPPGEFTVPKAQTQLGEWRWTLTGAGVSGDPVSGYRVRVAAAAAPTIVVILR
ncbi:MAG: hypothetical protein AAB368_10955 [bacterium]